MQLGNFAPSTDMFPKAKHARVATIGIVQSGRVDAPPRLLLDLPPEIVYKIIHNVSKCCGEREASTTYQTLNLVCSVFGPYVRPYLLKSITVNTAERLEGLITWLTSVSHKYKALINILRFDRVYIGSGRRRELVTQARVAILLRLTTNLRGIHFGWFSSTTLKTVFRESLASMKHLTAVSLETHHSSLPYSGILESVQSLPKLRSLMIDDRSCNLGELQVGANITHFVYTAAGGKYYGDIWRPILRYARSLRYLDIGGDNPTPRTAMESIPSSVIALRICAYSMLFGQFNLPFGYTFDNIVALAMGSEEIGLPYFGVFPNLQILVVYAPNYLLDDITGSPLEVYVNRFRQVLRLPLKHLVFVLHHITESNEAYLRALVAAEARDFRVSYSDYMDIDLLSLAEGKLEVRRMEDPEMRWLPTKPRRY